jgi:ubiquinone/menaquinone biosynthesis C-methylase UbiE
MRIQYQRIPEGGAIEDESVMSAEEYGNLMLSRLEGEYRRFASSALAFASPHQGGRVLEVGPGPGWAGILLLAQRPDLSLAGVDSSTDMIRAASANAAAHKVGDRASYRLGSAEKLEGIADASVDLVISRDSLHHWDDPRAAFSSMLRVLRPEGKVYLSDERRDLSLSAWALVYAFGQLSMGGMSKYWRSSIRSAYTPEELRVLLPEAPGREWVVEGGFIDLSLRLIGS